MTLNEVINQINERDGKGSFISDWEGVYNISREEAETIAAASNSLENFENIWRYDNWWEGAL